MSLSDESVLLSPALSLPVLGLCTRLCQTGEEFSSGISFAGAPLRSILLLTVGLITTDASGSHLEWRWRRLNCIFHRLLTALHHWAGLRWRDGLGCQCRAAPRYTHILQSGSEPEPEQWELLSGLGQGQGELLKGEGDLSEVLESYGAVSHASTDAPQEKP